MLQATPQCSELRAKLGVQQRMGTQHKTLPLLLKNDPPLLSEGSVASYTQTISVSRNHAEMRGDVAGAMVVLK